MPSFYALDVVRAITGEIPDHRQLARDSADEAGASLAWPAPKDPDRAIEDWIQFARGLGADTMQLSAAPHPTEMDIASDAMLDPVANTLDLRQRFDQARARRVEHALAGTGLKLSDLAYFDNLLHHDPAVRRKKREFMRRVFDAAVLLGVDAVCGFVGRDQSRGMDENLRDFEEHFVPLLSEAKAR